MRRLSFFLLAVVFAPIIGHAQSSEVDYQFRPLVHGQYVISMKSGIGVGFWGALSDTTRADPFKRWAAAGLLVKREKRWLEVMAGAGRFYKDATISPVIDVRFSDTSTKRVRFFGEVFYPTRKVLFVSAVTTPLVKQERFLLEAGGEADIWVGLGTKGVDPKTTKSSYGGGPRIAVLLWKKVSISVAYHFSTKILRNYLVVVF